MDKILHTIEEAAERLSIGRTKAYELVSTGQLRSVTIGRCRRITPEALEEFVAGLVDDRDIGHNRAVRWDEQPVADREPGTPQGIRAGPPDEDSPPNRGRVP